MADGRCKLDSIVVFLLLLIYAGHALDIPTIPGSGTDGGKLCRIPFSYAGTNEYACTYRGSTAAWCATGNSDSQWGQCKPNYPGSFPSVSENEKGADDRGEME